MPDADDLVHLHRPAAPGAGWLLLLHGRGGSEGDLVGVADAVLPGAGLLAPRGPEPQPPGWAWFTHHEIGVPVRASLDARLAEVAGWLEAVLARHGVDGPVTAVGFSNGGMMAGALLSARPDLVGAAALLSSGYPLPEHVTALGGLRGRRVLITGGDADPFHTVDTLRAGARAYRDAGAEVEAVVEPGAPHAVTMDQAAHLARWLSGAGT